MNRDECAAACDCHLHEKQVCDVCQGVDPEKSSPDVELDVLQRLEAVAEEADALLAALPPTNPYGGRLAEAVGKLRRRV